MNIDKIVLATGNSGKVKEFSELFASQKITVVAQSEYAVESVPETGTTFVENAIIKARHAAVQTGLPAIADDSGLVVEALNGAPGIYSSRFAGCNATDSENIFKLLEALKNQPNRGAHFHCCLVFMRHADDPIPIICEGQWYGEITVSEYGDGGFGYDPVFFDKSIGSTAAQMQKQHKNKVSHRAIALKSLLTQMRAMLD